MSNPKNKIEANDRTVHQVLNEQKYTVDYFQREYSWGQKHIEQLITDLTSAFQNEYKEGDSRNKGAGYNNYYLGPFVVSDRDGKRSIIDGQQRLTSLTLFLIYLNHLQKEMNVDEKIEEMIFSEHRGSKSFNIEVDERAVCLENLFNYGTYELDEDDDASTINMAARYEDIAAAFPADSFNVTVLPFFLDWLKYNVILVEIIAYSDDNAYVIFETMNDRGLNLTPAEMLKGYILSRFSDEPERQRANDQWKKAMRKLSAFDKEEDQRFFQAWLRGQYAETIRAGKAGSVNEDFEKVGTRFHNWFRENLPKMNLDAARPEGFTELIDDYFKYYLKAYTKIKEAETQFVPDMEFVYYIQAWGIATSLSYPLMLAPLSIEDDSKTAEAKINMVARYIETFVVKRSINFRTFAASGIRYTMYTLVKEIRNKSLEELEVILRGKISAMEEEWDGISDFRLHGQNNIFVRFLLSRITAFIEHSAGMDASFSTYFRKARGKKPFEVEHIIANKFERHRDEFEQEKEFEDFRNSIGGLVLLPRGTNQSYSDKTYEDKAPHYIKENLLAKSLCPETYESNPNFINMKTNSGLSFMAHSEFKKEDLAERTTLYQQICEQIWSWDDEQSK